MTIPLRASRVRFACNVDSHAAVVDTLTNQVATTWRGVPVSVEFALFAGASIIDSKAEIVKVYFQLHTNRNLGPLWMKELAGSSLDVTVTGQQWTAGTHQQGAFALTAEDMQIDLSGSTDNRKTFFWVLWAELTGGVPITCGCGQWIVEEDGAANSLPLTPASNLNVRQSPLTGLMQLQSPRTGYWHAVGLRDVGDGTPVQIVVDQTGEAS